MDDFLADVFVVECVIHIIREAKVVSWVVDFSIDNYVLLLSFFFFVEAYKGSQSEVCNRNYGVVIHSSFRSLEVFIGYVRLAGKDQ